ncbi:hypothetical protein PULV_a1082 [Pseudoalteromonas ulvae UL12]|nr:hypothetical protein [Pseudoalteromonas ulvae UL12]
MKYYSLTTYFNRQDEMNILFKKSMFLFAFMNIPRYIAVLTP